MQTKHIRTEVQTLFDEAGISDGSVAQLRKMLAGDDNCPVQLNAAGQYTLEQPVKCHSHRNK